jgi:hypothetical protein
LWRKAVQVFGLTQAKCALLSSAQCGQLATAAARAVLL